MTGGAPRADALLPITGLVVCQDDDEGIEACLRSLAACRELIVVDGGSTDRTVPIVEALRAEGFPIVLLHQPWLGPAGQTQFALSRATQPWCLSLEADEWLDPDLQRSLPALIAAPPDVAGWRLRREPADLRQAGPASRGADAKPVLRLVRRAAARCAAQTSVHETLGVEGRTLVARAGLVRRGRVLSFADLIATQLARARVTAAERVGQGRSPSRLRMVVDPPLCFLRLFFLHRWFLAGRLGFASAAAAAFSALAVEALHFEQAAAAAPGPRPVARDSHPLRTDAALSPARVARQAALKIYFHGNCQAPILHRLIGEVRPEWSLGSYEVFSDAIVANLDHYRHLVRTADVVVAQPIWTGYRGIYDLSTEWITQNKPDTARLITIPSLFFRGLHPAVFYLRDEGEDIQNVGMPYHDMTLLYLLSQRLGHDAIVDALCSPALYSRDFVHAEFATALEELRRREDADQLTVRLSPWLAACGARRQTFHVINHPTREVMAFVANAILEALGEDPAVSSEGHDDLGRPHIPPAPSVLHHLGSPPAAGMDDFLLGDPTQSLARRPYYARTIDLMSVRSPADIYTLIARQDEQRGFLDRLKQDNIDRFL